MEPVSSGTPPPGGASSAPDQSAELAAAFRELRSAIARREDEHARRERNRAIFMRGVLVLVLGILVGLWALMKSFDVDVFKTQLESNITAGAPSVLRAAKLSLEGLVPVYQAEVQRTLPGFSLALTDAVSKEAGNLAGTIAPLAQGEATIYTGEADGELAKLLMTRFGKDLHNDFGEARAAAAALRNAQILTARNVLDNELAGPFASLHDIELSLRGMGPPDKELLSKGDTVEALGQTALDLVKARIVSGEGFGFGEAKKSSKKAEN